MRQLFINIALFLSLLLVSNVGICHENSLFQDLKMVELEIQSLLDDAHNDSTLSKLNEALKRCVQYRLHKNECNVRLRIAKELIFHGRYTESQEHLDASLEIIEHLNDTTQLITYYRILGLHHHERGNLDLATSNYLQAYELALQHNIEDDATVLINNLATIFNEKGLYHQAIKHYKKSLDRNPGLRLKSIVMGNMALSFIKLKEFDSARYYLQTALNVCEEVPDKDCTYTPLSLLVMLFQNQQELDSALKYSDQLLAEFTDRTEDVELIIRYNQRGLIFLNKGDGRKAIPNFRKALKIANKAQYKQSHLLHANLAFAYEILGMYDSAYLSMIDHLYFRDSMERVNTSSKVEDLLIKYEAREKEHEIKLLQKENELRKIEIINQQNQFEKKQLQEQLEAQAAENKIRELKATNELQFVSLQKEKMAQAQQENQIALLEKEKELKQAELDRQKVKQVAIASVATLIVLAVLILLEIYRQKERATKQLAEQAEEINRQKTKELIRENEMKEIKANIAGQEKERIRIAKELHDSVAGNLAGIKLGLERLSGSNGDQEVLTQVKKNIDQTYHEVRSISANLSPIKSKEVGFSAFLSNYINDLNQLHPFEIEFNCSVDKAFSNMSDHQKLETYRILQELMNNIVKHADAEFIEVSINEVDGHLNILVEDNGKGFCQQSAKMGMGLKNIQSRVKKLNGIFNIDSVIDRGTIVNLDLPVHE